METCFIATAQVAAWTWNCHLTSKDAMGVQSCRTQPCGTGPWNLNGVSNVRIDLNCRIRSSTKKP